MFENLKLDDYTRTHIQVTVLNVCCCDIDTTCCCPLNSVCSQYIPSPSMSDQYQADRQRKISIRGLLIDPITNSQN